MSPSMPLSGAQAGIWLAQRLDPANPVHNVADRVDLHGPLLPGVFERALERCLAEAEPLRLRFTEEPTQYLPEYDSLRGCLTVLDLRGQADPEAAARDWMAADRRTPVDVVTGRLSRHALLRLADDHHVWYVRAHHILIDAHALSMIVSRVGEIYTALADGLTPGAGPFGSMAAVLAEEEAYRGSQRYGRDRAYWLERLAGAPEPAGLAGTPDLSARETVRRRAPLPPAGHWDELARQTRATWADVAAAGLACYLGRLTGTTDVLVGLPLANRTGAALHVPCPTVNVLPVRLDVRPARTVAEVVGDAARRIVEARRHGRYRIEDLRRDLGLGGTSRALFGPLLDIRPFPSEVKFAAARAGVTNLASGPVDDLAVAPLLDGDRLTLELDGNAARYTGDALAAHARRLAGFLAALGSCPPGTPIGRLSLLSDEDRSTLNLPSRLTVPAARQPADDAPPAGAAGPRPPTVVDAFLTQVRDTPGQTALTCEGESLTFAELGARVERLARRLAAHGAGPERVVAVALPRSAELVVALLAVLRSGAAFLPVDPAGPADRRELMLADADPSIVLNQEWLAAQAGLAHEDGIPLAIPDPGHPAYVIHTSGSTGRPKGVVGTHRGLAALLDGHRERLFPDGERLRVAHTASFSFDASLDPLLWMIGGHELHLLGDDVYRDPEALTAYVRDHGIDYLDLTPAHLKELPALLAAPPRIVVVGGEPVPGALWRTLRERALAVNHYGPAESAVDAYTWLGDGSEGPTGGTSVHVLDDALHPAPPGVAGELYLSGDGLARGYLGRPDLTAGRFVAGPGGTRVYRTGDRARWAAPGRLELLGRADDQVKVRGVRIEPAEIEAVLEGHDGVTAAAVTVHGDRLIAYVVPATATGEAPDAGEAVQGLAAYAAARLPAGMTPAAIVALTSLPRTPDGKLDRTALPAPHPAPARRGPARNPAERMMCALFAEVLGLRTVGRDDAFFDLGGHSLLAARLAVRVRETFGRSLPIKDVFATPTPAELVTRLGTTTVERPPPAPRTRPRNIPLSSAQAGLWFQYRIEGPNPTYNLPLALRLHGEVDRAALREALGDVVARHEILRTVFPEHDGVPRQQILHRPALALPVWQPDDPAQAMQVIARRGFDLAAEPPFRAHLLRLGPDEHVLMLVLHHIAADGRSAGPLTADVLAAYEARKKGTEPAFEPPPFQYADYTLWQRDLPRDLGLEHWREALAGLPDQLDLPFDRPRPAVSGGAGGTVPVALPPALMRAARQLARESGASAFMVLHAALAALLTRLGAGTDLPIGTTVPARDDSALDGAVGYFANTLVLRADTSGDPSFAKLLERVKAADLAAFEHGGLPFDRLVAALNPPRSRDRHPLFQVMLVHQDAPEPAGVSVVHTGTAKFDLTLNLGPTGSGFLEYSRDLFDRATAAGLAGTYTLLLDRALADPSAPIGRLDLLAAGERRTLAEEWNGEPGPTLPDLFEKQARRTPAAVAAADLTFAGLNARANRLAHKLIAYGARPGAIVALSLPRSPDLVTALLAVLKTGAACLPLDPAERTSHVLADAGPVCVVDEDWLADLDDWLDHDPELEPGDLTSPGLRVHVLDDALRPVPPGVVGEVYVAGDGLARGYLGRPGLTAGRFVAGPSGRPGTRMYRSGGLARWRPDGTLDHLRREVRAALPTPPADRLPDGPREETMCALFAEVLGVRRVGVHDGFFDLGGHSLPAVRLVARVREVFGAEVSVGELFEAPTAAGLAALVEGGARRDPLKVLLPLREPGSKAPLFCVHPAGGLSWCYGGLLRHVPDRPIYGLQARRDRLPASLRKLAADYVAQLRLVRPCGPYHLLGWSTGGVIAHEMAVQLRLAGQEVALLAILDARPAEALRDLPPSGEAQALEALLTMGGLASDGALTLERVVEILRREAGPLAALPAGTLAELKDAHLNTDRLVRGLDTRRYDGDVLFFGDTSTGDAWRPYVSGAIETHEVACGHKDMTQPGPIAGIGAIVAARLRELDR